MNLFGRIFKRKAKRKRRAQYMRGWRQGQHKTDCPVCLELKRLHLPFTSHVEPATERR